MWQRIQTLFLGIATLLVVSMYWCDLYWVVGDTEEHFKYTDSMVHLVWLIILTVLQVLSLGGYKWRMKQLRVVIFTAIVCLGFQGWLVYDYIKLHQQVVFSWTILFPFACAVLDIMGARNIMLDEAIVQSANRLRRPRNKKH